jgi:hypothetical protein
MQPPLSRRMPTSSRTSTTVESHSRSGSRRTPTRYDRYDVLYNRLCRPTFWAARMLTPCLSCMQCYEPMPCWVPWRSCRLQTLQPQQKWNSYLHYQVQLQAPDDLDDSP